MRFSPVLFVAAICAACTVTPDPSPSFGGRELRPAKAGINVGSLYFARERATNDQNEPVNLERLCEINLARYDIQPMEDVRVADIDLTAQLEAAGALSGIKNYFVEIGLSGSFSDYFEYKATNVRERSITLSEAEKIFTSRAFDEDCKYWRSNVSRENWARYQVLSLKTGDIVFQQRNNASLGADVSGKIATVEPALKASLKRDFKLILSGSGLVFAVSPIVRE